MKENESERLTEHFALHEFLKSRTADRHRIPNVPLKCHIDLTRNRRMAFKLTKR